MQNDDTFKAASHIESAVEYVTIEFDCTAAELVGILEIIKARLIQQSYFED